MDMTIGRIPLVLKRFTFEEKMALCQKMSRQIMKPDKLEFIAKKNAVLPWEIETFCTLSLISQNEHANQTFCNNRGMNTIFSIINCIRNYQHPQLLGDNLKIDYYLMATAQQQFLSQRNVRTRLFRYNYLFNFQNTSINMPLEVQKVYGTEYREILEAVWVIYLLIGIQNMSQKVLNYAFNKYGSVLAKFSKTREEYINLQTSFFPNDADSYIYGFKAIYPYPIITNRDIAYLPVPYLLIDAATESVLNELTRDNGDLRSLIGKHAVEGYLLYLLKAANCYDEVVTEVKYDISSKCRGLLSPDVMICSGDRCVFFDCKASVPSLKLRDFDLDKIRETKEKYADNISKLYFHINNYLNHSYNPFSSMKYFQKENIYGVVVVLEDSYITRDSIYNEVAKRINSSIDSENMRYIKSNIKLVGFDEIEQASFGGEDYGIYLESQRNNPAQWNDYGFVTNKNLKPAIPELTSFYDSLIDFIYEFNQEIINNEF